MPSWPSDGTKTFVNTLTSLAMANNSGLYAESLAWMPTGQLGAIKVALVKVNWYGAQSSTPASSLSQLHDWTRTTTTSGVLLATGIHCKRIPPTTTVRRPWIEYATGRRTTALVKVIQRPGKRNYHQRFFATKRKVRYCSLEWQVIALGYPTPIRIHQLVA